jgi:stage V sporulation protein SpoVS
VTELTEDDQASEREDGNRREPGEHEAQHRAHGGEYAWRFLRPSSHCDPDRAVASLAAMLSREGRTMGKLIGFAVVVAAVAALGVAPAAVAKDGDVRVAGTCTGPSTSKLKLGREDGGRIEVEFEVDQNRVGRRWAVVLRHNGVVVRRLVRVTRAPSGSFEARALLADRAGADRIVATGTRAGESCRAAARI